MVTKTWTMVFYVTDKLWMDIFQRLRLWSRKNAKELGAMIRRENNELQNSSHPLVVWPESNLELYSLLWWPWDDFSTFHLSNIEALFFLSPLIFLLKGVHFHCLLFPDDAVHCWRYFTTMNFEERWIEVCHDVLTLCLCGTTANTNAIPSSRYLLRYWLRGKSINYWFRNLFTCSIDKTGVDSNYTMYAIWLESGLKIKI